jgi:Tfp pilus assembly protein PilF
MFSAMLLMNACAASQIDKEKSETRLNLAKDFLSKRQFENAESEANRSLAFNPKNEEAYVVRGLVHFIRAATAQHLMEGESCLTGLDAEAMTRDLETELKTAGADFATATQLANDYSEAWHNRGLVAKLQDDPDHAIEYFRKALENPVRLVDPGTTRAQLGASYLKKNDAVSAAKELRTALQFQPDLCLASYELGRVYFLREEWEKAAEQFLRVIETDGNPDPQKHCNQQQARLNLMQVRLKQGLLEEAEQAKQACLVLSTKSCVAVQCKAGG